MVALLRPRLNETPPPRRWDETADTYRARAKITDVAGTSTFDPCIYPRVSYSVVATFYWRGATTGQETWRPNNGWALLCA